MTSIRIPEFGGAVPRTNPELLGRYSAQTAIDCNLLDGKLSGWANTLNIMSVASGVKAVLKHKGYWLTFQQDVNSVPNPIAGDLVGRLYFSGDGAPRMTDLSRAVIGETNLITLDGTSQNVPHTYEPMTSLSTLGVGVGDTLNASAQLQATGGDLVGGAVQVVCYDVSNNVLATFTGSLVQGGAEYGVSILTGAVVPANTTQLSVGTVCTSGTGVTSRYCYLTKGAFTTYPVASDLLGVPSPTVLPRTGRIVPQCSIIGGSINSQNINSAGVSPSIDTGGAGVTCTGTWYCWGTTKASNSGHVTVSLEIDGSVVDSENFAIAVHGSATEPGDYNFSGSFKLTGGPDTGAHTYALTITTDVNLGGGTVTERASGVIYEARSVDLTLQGWTASTAKTFEATITDTHGNIWMVTTPAGGTTKSGSAPAGFSATANFGDVVTDNNLTWVCLGNWNEGSPTYVSIAGVRGMSSVNGYTYVMEVVGNVVTVHMSTTQTYIAGGTMSLILGTTNSGDANGVDTAYCYTYVANLDGLEMESGPSPASPIVTVRPQEAVIVFNFPATPSGYSITALRLYRVVTATDGTAAFTFVAEIATSDGNVPGGYFDTASDSQLSGLLPTAAFVPPPVDMVGMHATPNGVIVGFHNNEVLLSEPYFPHAYPIEYRQSTKYPIVATVPCGGDSIAVLTQGKPTMLIGRVPGDMNSEEVNLVLPCLSGDSAVDMGYAVLYASSTGICSIGTTGADVITQKLFTKKQWAALNPASIIAARYNDKYIGFYSGGPAGNGGFIFDPKEPGSSWVYLDFVATALWTDPSTGDLYMVVANELVQWNAGNGSLSYTWRSSDNVSPHPVNLGVAKVRAADYNNVTLTLFADGVQKFQAPVTSSDPIRLPDGYMATVHSLQLTGTSEVLEVIAAETMAELKAGTSTMAEAQRAVG